MIRETKKQSKPRAEEIFLLCRGAACFRHLCAKEIGVVMVESRTKI